MNFLRSRILVFFVVVCSLPSCAVKSHQFADAIYRGDVRAASLFHQPGYANMRFSISRIPGKYALPIQYAILQRNRPMAKFLLDRGSPRVLEGNSLVYYCSYYGVDEMARYFADLGEGSYSDIQRARNDLVIHRRQKRNAAAITALIGLGVLAAMMWPSGEDGSSSNGGIGPVEWFQMERR